MGRHPKMEIDQGYFATRNDVFRDMIETGFWPTTYISARSPELPLHWHDGDIIGYLVHGRGYVLDEDGRRHDLEPGDRLRIPAGALHAEGEVTEPNTYIVTTRQCEPFLKALRMLDPAAYPEPELLKLDPALARQLGLTESGTEPKQEPES